jgi:hypothetical protein
MLLMLTSLTNGISFSANIGTLTTGIDVDVTHYYRSLNYQLH